MKHEVIHEGLHYESDDSFQSRPKYVVVILHDINPITDTINGGDESYRWSKKTAKEIDAINKHKESIGKYGLLLPFPVVRVPADFEARLDGKTFVYKTDTYITIDFNGRLRAYKEKLEENNINIKEYPIVVCDITNQVLGSRISEITSEDIEKLWEVVVTMSTGQSEWDAFQFINSGAKVLTNPIQQQYFRYCSEKMVEYAKGYSAGNQGQLKLSNRNVLHAILGGIPSEKNLRKKRLNFDLKRIRYTDLILEQINWLRKQLNRGMLPGPFIDILAKFFLSLVDNNFLQGKVQKHEEVYDDKKKKMVWKWVDYDVEKTFPINHEQYTDEHYTAFEECVNFTIQWINDQIAQSQRLTPTKDPSLPAAGGDAQRWLWANIKDVFASYNGQSDDWEETFQGDKNE